MGAYGENHGVASAIFTGGYNSERPAGAARGWDGVSRNTGLIEAISTFDAIGVAQFLGNNFTNTGFIYVEGGASYTAAIPNDPLGIIAYRSGGTDIVNNSGTIHVVSNTPLVRSVGFSFFPNATNIYSPNIINNSGTIVADRAIIALDGFQGDRRLLIRDGGIDLA